MDKLKAYHGDEKFKRDFVAMAILHREQDRYIKGTFSEKDSDDADFFKGCSVGCSIRSLKLLGKNGMDYNNHAKLAESLGWPDWLTLLQDTIFERLPQSESETWTEELAQAVPVGVDLSVVKWQFCAFLMRENIERVIDLKMDEESKKKVLDSIRSVLSLHEKAALGNIPESAAWSAAESAARSASWSAAESEAESAAESAARSAAWSAAESAAESAAWSAARSAAWSAAWSAAFVKYKKELLRLIKEVK